MQVHVLTYDHPHRKTQDLLWHLKVRGYDDVTVIALPWEERKNFRPLFKTKAEPFEYSFEQLCRGFGYRFHYSSISNLDLFPPDVEVVWLIAGAPVLSKFFVENHTVFNSHCGWLPEVRGLDSLKWAIYYDKPIGVTSHIVSPEVDLGLLIERWVVPVESADSLYSLAMRQYELEIDLLIKALDKYKDAKPFDEPAVFPPTRRMPHRTEVMMMRKFEAMKTEMFDQ